jgi:hypothetical protein
VPWVHSRTGRVRVRAPKIAGTGNDVEGILALGKRASLSCNDYLLDSLDPRNTRRLPTTLPPYVIVLGNLLRDCNLCIGTAPTW